MYNIDIEYVDGSEEQCENVEDYSYDGNMSITLEIDSNRKIDIMLHSIKKVSIEEIISK